MRAFIGILVATGLLVCLETGVAAEPMRRFVLAAGANDGGDDRVTLRYAATDAEEFSEVMLQMGGATAGNSLLLKDPDLADFAQAVDKVTRLVKEARGEGARTEVWIYYSGHADEESLLLGGERLGYRELRKMMDGLEADVRVAVLDACASGAITRIKGGQRRKAFLVDASSDTRGYAFLTSSSAEETAQESDRIQASFFTHYLVSGMRGAADVSGDGKVTLSEAYQFALDETLAQTIETQGGAQHPAYQFNLSGIGDVVMTDLRQTSAGLVLTEELEGRLFVRSDDRRLVAELFKPKGKTVELGLEPGDYEIYLARKEALLVAREIVERGDRLVLLAGQFQPARRERTAIRGLAPPGARPPGMVAPHLRLSRRYRLELHFGKVGPQPRRGSDIDVLRSADAAEASSIAPASLGNLEPWSVLSGLTFGYWARENFALTLTYSALGSSADNNLGPQLLDGEVELEDVTLVSVLLGVRRYFPFAPARGLLRPYISAELGTFISSLEGRTIGESSAKWTRTMGSFGGQLGAGVDIQMNRHFMLGARAAYNLMTDFDEAVGGRLNYNGGEFRIGVSWLFGRGDS